LIHTRDGATLSAVVVRRSDVQGRLPAALTFTIYVDPPQDLKTLEYAADRGYVGVMAYTRGKAYSPQRIVPYEDDGRDADNVISWIAKQAWSNGKVGMFGGSYDGFTQWAAAKFANPHLKTIVPSVPNNPANGLPMQNSIFLPVNYAWIYYVTDNKFLDNATYNDPRWNALNGRWYRSGRAYRDIDAVAGVPNPWLHTWLAHPSYDAYWQRMGPYRGDYARINIPVLTIAGYYGDSTAIGYIRDHQTYNASAQDYLVMGPWDHFGTQGRVKPAVLRGYRIDAAAQIDTWKLTFDWFDYVMRGKARPALVSDHVNYEVMGENVWRHASSIAAMGNPQRLYLSNRRVSKGFYLLSPEQQSRVTALHQRVDFADRNTANNDSYPYIILGKKPDLSNGYSFVTRPFTSAAEVSGFDGSVHLRINKRDVDIGLALYEILPDGKLFQLTYFTQRASYAQDMSKRHLLTPGAETAIPFDQYYLFSRRISKGSRLLLTVNVNKNPFAEINYGTGRDVSTESIRDAGTPLEVQWLTNSFIRIRLAVEGAH
jgi:putative CocE/NonD family hydrolase